MILISTIIKFSALYTLFLYGSKLILYFFMSYFSFHIKNKKKIYWFYINKHILQISPITVLCTTYILDHQSALPLSHQSLPTILASELGHSLCRVGSPTIRPGTMSQGIELVESGLQPAGSVRRGRYQL